MSVESLLQVETRWIAQQYAAGDLSDDAFLSWVASRAEDAGPADGVFLEVERRVAEWTTGHLTREEVAQLVRAAATHVYMSEPKARYSSTATTRRSAAVVLGQDAGTTHVAVFA